MTAMPVEGLHMHGNLTAQHESDLGVTGIQPHGEAVAAVAEASTLDSAFLYESANTSLSRLLSESAPLPRYSKNISPISRALLAATSSVSEDVWYGYNVHHKQQPAPYSHGNYPPRYVGGRNEVLGGLYLQQVEQLSGRSGLFACDVRLNHVSFTCG